MKAFSVNPEAHDDNVHTLTETMVREWRGRIQAEDKRAINDLVTVAIDKLVELEAAAIFTQALTDPAGANGRFAKLVADAMRDVCEADAERAVSYIETSSYEAYCEQQIDAAREVAA